MVAKATYYKVLVADPYGNRRVFYEEGSLREVIGRILWNIEAHGEEATCREYDDVVVCSTTSGTTYYIYKQQLTLDDVIRLKYQDC